MLRSWVNASGATIADWCETVSVSVARPDDYRVKVACVAGALAEVTLVKLGAIMTDASFCKMQMDNFLPASACIAILHELYRKPRFGDEVGGEEMMGTKAGGYKLARLISIAVVR